jgi:hypothetical protein
MKESEIKERKAKVQSTALGTKGTRQTPRKIRFEESDGSQDEDENEAGSEGEDSEGATTESTATAVQMRGGPPSRLTAHRPQVAAVCTGLHC